MPIFSRITWSTPWFDNFFENWLSYNLKCVFQQNNLINTLIWEIFWKLSNQFRYELKKSSGNNRVQKIRQINVCQICTRLNQLTKASSMFALKWELFHLRKIYVVNWLLQRISFVGEFPSWKWLFYQLVIQSLDML